MVGEMEVEEKDPVMLVDEENLKEFEIKNLDTNEVYKIPIVAD
jgi:hypothetical protein